uniref:Neuron navigator 3 n=1 Tax=Astyanax mexicanus TaxID=7994 RepID=A0A8B9JKD4_ASTMX
MPVVGVASKLRPPLAGARPVHTALPIPNPGAQRPVSRRCGAVALCVYKHATQHVIQRPQLSVRDRPPHCPTQLLTSHTENLIYQWCAIYTDWANHYLTKAGCPRLIKDLTQDIPDGVLLAQIIQIIGKITFNGNVHISKIIENVEACLTFLEARGVSVQSLTAEEVCKGNLKSILGLFFILSRYKQQQQQQQQYLQSLVELQQQVTHQSTGAAPASHKTQDMQSSLTARYANPAAHSGIAVPQKKNTRLPGPSRTPTAGSVGNVSKAPPSSSALNRRSQSFNSIDKNRPLQYASGNERVKSIPLVGSMNGSTSGQQLASAIPSPTAGKAWRSKSMNMKHSATSSMLATSPTSSPPSPCATDRPRAPLTDASKAAPGNQRSMLDKFRLINPRSASRTSPSMAEMALQEEDDLSEYGDECFCSPVPSHGTQSSSSSTNNKNASKALPQPKDKEEKSRTKSKASSPPKEEPAQVETAKKTSRIASMIPKGGKAPPAKKESAIPASSSIPKPGLKAPAASAGTKPTGAQPGSGMGAPAKEGGEKTKGGKGGQPYYMQRLEGRKSSMVSSTSTSALSGSTGSTGGGVVLGGNGAVQLPQQQQHNHPNTATVAPFICRTYSENDCTAVIEPCLSPTKELIYSKTAKQCLEEISGEDPETRRMRTVKNIADLRQNLEETMSSLRGTQISHSTLETTFDTTVTTEVNGRGLPALSSRSSPMAWRLAQSQSPRLQAGDAPSIPGYVPPRPAAASGQAGRYTDTSRFVYTAPLRRAATTGGRGAEPGEKGVGSEAGPEGDVGGYMSDGDILAKNVRAEDITSGYCDQNDGSSWGGAEELKKVEEEMEAMDSSSRWKTSSSAQGEEAGQKGASHTSMGHTGSWRRGMSAQAGITPPRTKGTTPNIKSTGKTDDAKASEKGKSPCKSPSIQRSPSDAGKSSGDEGKKPPSGIGRPAATGSFGFKKIPCPSGPIVTASGATLSSGSATLGKIPKSAGIGKGGPGRKTSLDGCQHQDDGVLLGVGTSKVTLQYRSLPRPAKSSSGVGGVARSGYRSSSSSIDSNVSGKSAGGGSKRRDGGKVGSGRSSPVTVNQTDKEKVAVSDQDGAALSTSPKSSPTSTGLRQPGSKYPDIASPTFRRLFGSKASSKPSSPGTPDSGKCPSVLGSPHGTLARQPSLDSPSSGTGSMGSSTGVHSGGRTPEPGMDSPASSPASALSLPSNARPWPPTLSSSSAGSKETLSCQSLTSLHTSSESIDLPLPHHHHHAPKVTRTGSVKSTLSEGMTLDRNTLPKKGLRHPPSSRQTSHDEGKEWLRSHSTGGLQDTGSPLSPPGSTGTSAGKYHYSNLLSPTSMSQFPLCSGSMSRSNSIPEQDRFELFADGRALGGSATSLEERPRAMSRSGSFRDSTDEGTSQSVTEEKAHSEQIRKLRRELDASQEKVATLTSQLAANSHLVAAFEKSLGNMTGRLQSLTMTAEQKESELAELRETIEALKTQNTDAQTAIQVALNGPDHLHRDLKIRRQHSSESMSSITSAASHSSLGSCKDSEDKKKKKKSWLRSSFKQAFGKKKSTKLQTAHDELDEIPDSLPASPKLQHQSNQGSTPTLLCECTEAEAEIILQLKNELREKELKLTDIRLEALSSAHHLDQIREAMNRMQNEIETLKAENDRLKSSGNSTPSATPAKTARPPSETSSTSSSSSRQSLGLSLNNLNITDTIILICKRIVATGLYSKYMNSSCSATVSVMKLYDLQAMKGQEYLIGSIGVSGKTKWDVLDGVIRRLFKEYVFRVDPLTSLGLNSDSIVSYRMGEVIRSHAAEVPELLPCGYLVGDNNIISVTLKGVRESSIDDLVFDTLIPKPIMQRYLNLLMEHRRIILSGPSGTGKSHLATKLAHYIITKSGREVTEANLACFNVDQKSSKDLRQYLSTLAEQCNSEHSEVELPLVVILDNLHHIGSLSDIFNGFLNCKYHKCPYVIGTMNQGVSSSPNLELHHNFRWVLCANHTEPVRGFLGRFLRRKLIEMEIDKNTRSNELIKIIDWIPKTWQHLNGFLEAHSSSDVTIGPRLFLSCPMEVEGCRVWFTDLWNYSLVPYLQEAVREGLQLYGKRAAWEDPCKWVMDTYPWSAALLQHDGQSLLQLRPEDVGYDGYSSFKDGASSKQVSQSDTEGDPLMNMLMRLQEAANYSSTQSCDSDSTSHHDDQLDSSLESAL